MKKKLFQLKKSAVCLHFYNESKKIEEAAELGSFEGVQTCSNVFKLVQTRSNSFKLVQTSNPMALFHINII